MVVPQPRDAASDEEEDFHSGRDSGGDADSAFSDSDDDANVVLQPPGGTPAAGEHAKGQDPCSGTACRSWTSLFGPPRPRSYTTGLLGAIFPRSGLGAR